ncbi:helix-turn-helix domain-containing protein [Candidatus Roizmanbacteria bacterium]|nr:helix-turn-helix domain-containing protein [Candidatus Roizmanbacteria bacterium]
MNNSQRKLRLLIDEIMKINDRKTMENFLLGLLTPQEIMELPTRIEIVKLLKKGIPQVQIAKKLGIGVATVTRGSTEIKKGRFINIK